ncbi:hypothetical protein BCR44DRAFT_1497617 [Catenaria anguillulae PL171]|uniref:Uncharacterized protein n=1 Tax=Catenaria anguillulae PL171 TaxID=765915 RepID=A0A1Y2HU63_9FUNG|nr:hypothetical protein BCR44DRAFT_1497617 [Catenaria anguillulae PL171]
MAVPGDSEDRAKRPQDVLTQLVFTTSVSVLLLFALSAIHRFRLLERIYFPLDDLRRRIHAKGWLAWFNAIWSSTIEDVLAECGADGALIFCGLEMAIQYFAFATVIGLGLVLPFHVILPPPVGDNKPALNSTDGPPSGSNALFVHLAATWILVLAFYFFLHRTYRRVLSIKNRYMLGIPSHMTERDLRQYLDDLGIGEVQKVVLVRRSWRVEWALARRWSWLLEVERLAAQIPNAMQLITAASRITMPSTDSLLADLDERRRNFGSGDVLVGIEAGSPNSEAANPMTMDPEQSVNLRAIEPMPVVGAQTFASKFAGWVHMFGSWKRWMRMTPEARLMHAHTQFLAADARVHALRREFDRNSIPVRTAYVMFAHPVSGTIATQALVHGSLTELRVARAPAPADVYFSHLSITPTTGAIRAVAVGVAIFFLIFFWAVPIGAISSLLSLDELRKVWPGLVELIERSPVVVGIVEGVLPTLAVTLFMSLLPILLTYLADMRGFKSTADSNLFTFTSYFYFQIFNVLLVFTIAGTIFKALEDMIDQPSKIPMLLARSLPQLSPFFFNLLLLNAFVLMPNLILQIGRAIWEGLIARPVTPRETLVSAKRPLWCMYELSPTVLMLVIGQVYSVVCPLILPLTFCLPWLPVRVQTTNGRVWIEFVRMMQYGLTIYILLMIGILSLRKFYWSIALVPLLGIHFVSWVWIRAMERRVMSVPLDVWRDWRGDSVLEQADDVDGQCQGVVGVDRLALAIGYDNVLLHGELPVPWLPGMPLPTTFRRAMDTPRQLPKENGAVEGRGGPSPQTSVQFAGSSSSS